MSTVDSLLTWALDGIANVSMFLKLSVGKLNFNVLLKTLHTHAVLGLTVKHHHQITAGTCALHVNSLGIRPSLTPQMRDGLACHLPNIQA